VPTRSLLDQVLVWTEPARTQLGLDLRLPERNGAERARAALDGGASIEDIYRDAVAETRRTYAGAAEARQSA
jgi:glutamate---cysteine ligase / carboxylate-amine ligase